MKNLDSILLRNPQSLDKNSEIISVKARIVRNLADYKFSILNKSKDRKKIYSRIKNTLKNTEELRAFKIHNLYNMPKDSKKLLIEKNMISKRMAKKAAGKGIMIDHESEGLVSSILINEEDHLAIQCMFPGFDIDKVYNQAYKIETCLEDKLCFAFDRELGYLTSSPINVGSGLNLSVVVHLPGMVINSDINGFIDRLNKINCTVSGYKIKNSEVIGNLFIISKQSTLEKSDKDTVEEMKAICLNIIDEEKRQIDYLKKNISIDIADNIFRAYGVVKYAKLLSFEEAIELISIIRLGIDLGVLDNLQKFDFYYLINIIGNSYIKSTDGAKNKSVDYIDVKRANIIRKNIFKRD